MQHVTFKKTNSDFFDEIKEKTNDYFALNKFNKTGNYKLYIKSVVFILSLIISYMTLLFFTLPMGVAAIFYIILGVTLAGIGFNIMHDGAHGSYSRKKWLNELMAYSLNLMGGNAFIWKNKHNVNHHTYTNIEGMDDDIDIEPWMRTHFSKPKFWFHRYQHIYGLPLYGLTHFNWVFVSDLKKYFLRKIAQTTLNKMSFKEHFIFWLSKIICVSIFLIIPIIMIGFLKAIIGFAIMSFTCGFILGTVFQLAHVIEDAEFPMPLEGSNKMEQTWVLHQIATTVNFATKSKLLSWFTGGLNFQIVHHIFPKISHVHYPEINKLIRETCKKFSVKYTEYPTLLHAVRSHISYLKILGSVEDPAYQHQANKTQTHAAFNQ